MKSPPDYSVGFTYLCLFDSVFKEYSDPSYPRSNVANYVLLFQVEYLR